MSNFERALTEIPERGPRNRFEQREIWKRKLKEEMECERKEAKWLQKAQERAVFWEDAITRHNLWDDEMEKYDTARNYLFVLMHRVAYFDDLLGGTGISKDVSQTLQISTD